MIRHAKLLAVTTALGMLLVDSAVAQDTTRAMPTSLARVLAEAARDFPTGRPIYLVAKRQFPQYVVGAFSARARAERAAGDSGSSFGVFGPYVTPLDSISPDRPTIDSVVLYLHTPRGQSRFRVDPRADALFLTQSATRKFLVPYYATLYDPAVADSMFPDSTYGGCHVWGTTRCWLPGIVRVTHD